MAMGNNEKRAWHEYISPKARLTYLAALRYLSEREIPAVVVGSAALLARGYYQKFYWWDIDLLFSDVASLQRFREDMQGNNRFAVVEVEQELQQTPKLYSLHTLVSYKSSEARVRGWVNVDLIVRRDHDWYSFHRWVLESHGKFTELIESGDEVFPLDIFMAHPWGIFIEKVFSPRLVQELETGNSYSYDARDIFTILDKDEADPAFAQYLSQVLKCGLIDMGNFRKRFAQVMRHKAFLGYSYTRLPPLLQ